MKRQALNVLFDGPFEAKNVFFGDRKKLPKRSLLDYLVKDVLCLDQSDDGKIVAKAITLLEQQKTRESHEHNSV